MKTIDRQAARLALSTLLRDRSPLGAMEVLFSRVGRIFQIPLPSFNPYVIAGPEANRKLLVTDRDKVRWRNPDPVTDLLGRGVLVVDGDEHDHYRELMEPSLHPSTFSRYAKRMIAHTDRVASTWHEGQTVDMLVESRNIALLIIMDALFNVDVWDDLPKIWMPILKTIQYISPGPWIFWRKIPRPGYKKHIKALDNYLYGIIQDRRQGISKQDLLQHLIEAGLEDKVIRDQMLTMLIAGHDTSTALLAWTFYLLGTHPEVYACLVRELDEAMELLSQQKAPDRYPSLLTHIIRESLRLYPPIHLGNRMVVEDMNFDGLTVSAGERLVYSIYLSHRDPEHWENPGNFCPERFAGRSKTPPFTYVPFGGGPRTCIGAAFGQEEARIVLARLLHGYHFELMNTDVHPHMGATLEPSPGVLMRVTKRNS